MRKGCLSEYFKGIAYKYLSSVEVEPHTSHQHEFNGVAPLKSLFGENRQVFDATFLYMRDDDADPTVDSGKLTWYDARENHPKRSEYRLYFKDTKVSPNAGTGDLLILALRPDKTVLVVICEKDSTISRQLLWLFGFSGEIHPGFSVKGEREVDQIRLEFVAQCILEQIGVEQKETDENLLDQMLAHFPGDFPPTKQFSDFARKSLPEISAHDDPDTVILAWMEREETLFRTLERFFVEKRLEKGFKGEERVEEFLQYSLSVQNRRKSRAGNALENHLEFLFRENDIAFSHTPVTEGNSRPDFIFPGILDYRDHDFPAEYLTMLAVKTTCKDRWRQILTEAARIDGKHLFTLQIGISKNQMEEMGTQHVIPVIPKGILQTYPKEQQLKILPFSAFISLVKDRQQKKPSR